jgi:hypothetical protein
MNGYKEAVNTRIRMEYLAAKNKKHYTPDDQPLVKDFLKTAPGSR